MSSPNDREDRVSTNSDAGDAADSTLLESGMRRSIFDRAAKTFGRYRSVEEIGRGGMGAIYKAIDPELERPVAIKVGLFPHEPGSYALVKFLAEAKVTGQLAHPNIIPVHEMGRTADGKPYFVMKLVQGRSMAEEIRELAKDRASYLRRRVKLLADLVKVVDAVGYAHSMGVIHRDLKPANVMVGEFGEVLVMDWGLAKVRGQEWNNADCKLQIADSAEGAATVAGAVMGTPAYMPPEQAAGEIDRVDERSDIYSLGAILYEILTLAPPHSGNLANRLVAHDRMTRLEPPSRRARWAKIPRELDAAVARAMARRQEHRYPSALDLKRDVEAYLQGYPIAALTYSVFERAAKWIRRNPLTSAVAGVSLAVILAFLVGLVIALARANDAEAESVRQRDVAREREIEAQAARREEADAKTRERRRADEITLEQAKAALEKNPRRAIDLLGRISPEFGHTSAIRTIASDALARELPIEMRGHGAPVSAVAWSSDGRMLATGSHDHTVAIWEPESGRRIHVLEGLDQAVSGVTFSPDGGRLVTCGDDRLRIWDVESGQRLAVLEGHSDAVQACAWSSDGAAIASASRDGTARLWDPATGAPLSVLSGHEGLINTIAFSNDGKRLATASDDGTARVWDTRTGASLGVVELGGPVYWVAFNRDGTRVVAAGLAFRAAVADAATGEILTRPGPHDAWLAWAGFSHDGAIVVTAGADRTVREWDAKTGAARRTMVGHTDGVSQATWLADGGLATASYDATVRVWDLATGSSRVLRGAEGAVISLASSRDGSHVAAGSLDGIARVWSLAGDHARLLAGHDNGAFAVAFSSDGQTLASGGGDGSVRLWDVETWTGRRFQVTDAPVYDVMFAPDARSATGGSGGEVPPGPSGRMPHLGGGQGGEAPMERSGGHGWPERRDDRTLAVIVGAEVVVIDPSTGSVVRRLSGHSEPIRAAVFRPDGQALATAGLDAAAYVWPWPAGEPAALRGHRGPVHGLAWSPDGSVLATAGADSTIRLWRPGTSEAPRVLAGHTSIVARVAFTRDGTRLVSAGVDGTVRIWHDLLGTPRDTVLAGHRVEVSELVVTGSWIAAGDGAGIVSVWALGQLESPRVLLGHTQYSNILVASHDERTLASASWDATPRLWDLTDPAGPIEGRAFWGHSDSVHAIAFSPDDRLVATASRDGSVRVWTDDLPRDDILLREWLSRHASAGEQERNP